MKPQPRAKTLVLLSLLVASRCGANEEVRLPFLLQFTDDVATTAGIGVLKDTPLPEGHREIRVWLGFGIIVPEQMLRLQVTGSNRVSGQVLVHYPSDLSYMENDEATAFRKDVLSTCKNIRKGTEHDVCTSTFAQQPDWLRAYRKLLMLGIDKLPDESRLPTPDFVVTDGVAMVVEIRDGASYRAYEYSNPAFRKEPEAKAAVKIMHEVSDVFAMAYAP